MRQSNFLNWFFLAVCSIAVLAGIFQIGKLVSLAIYSNNFSINVIEVWQVSLISVGIWGVFEFVRTVKTLKLSLN